MSIQGSKTSKMISAPALTRVFVISLYPLVAWALEQLMLRQTDRHFVVDTAADPKAALAMLGIETKPDVTILDLDPDPVEVLAAMPALLSASAGRVLAITGDRTEETQDNAIMAGVHGVLEKDQPLELILKAIDKVHRGETWIDREAIGRIVGTLARRGVDQAQQRNPTSLTRRERDVTQHIMAKPGTSAKTLARTLGISENTLNNHLASIYSKLDVSNRLELYAYLQHAGGRQGPAIRAARPDTSRRFLAVEPAHTE